MNIVKCKINLLYFEGHLVKAYMKFYTYLLIDFDDIMLVGISP
jgi:hypothetical protein